MSLRSCPRLDALEAREVPAALSFQLPDGTIGSGLFVTPNGVDPAQASQTFNLPDLSVTKNNVVYTVQPGASATYANGVLVGVNAVANGPDTITLSAGLAQVNPPSGGGGVGGGIIIIGPGGPGSPGPSSAPVAYDGAATRDTFQFPDGAVGALSYAIPWGLVDSAQASQLLSPTAFNLNIAGQNFAAGSLSYTQPPMLVFAYGNFVGVSFSLTPPPGFAYTSVSGSFDMMSNNINAIKAGMGQQFVAAPVPQQIVVLDLASAYVGQDYKIRMTFFDGKGNGLQNVVLTVSKDDSAGDIANKIAAQINAGGNFTASVTGTRITLKTTATGRGWERLSYENLTTGNVPFQIPVPGPTIEKRNVVNVIGDVQQP